MSSTILKGLRVLDLSRMLSGPYCSMFLADHGAEVIKIESGTGDTSRNNGPYREDDPNRDWSGYFVSLNRGKKSIRLDLKSPEGKAAFRRLAATADVVLENFRPGVMDRLGLSYESLAEANPRLVYAAIRGFGDPRTGASPYADWPSYDVVAQSMGGLMAMTGPDADTPTKVGPGIGDIFAGMMMSFGILAALREAEATGKGRFVDVAMYDAMISMCERMVYLNDMTGQVAGPEGNGHPLLAPFGVFPAADGHVALGIVDDRFWQKLTEIMNRPDLGADERFSTRAGRSANSVEINGIVSDWTATRSKAELADLLGGHVPFGPLNTVADIVADPHVAARHMLETIPHPEPGHAPWTVAANPLRFGGQAPVSLPAPPRLGEHDALLDTLVDSAPLDDSARRDLRRAFGQFATGVTVLTTRQKDGTPRGFTANSFSSVSLDPPLLLVCLAKTAHSCDVFAQAPHFAVNILSDAQKEISGVFASRSAEKFAGTHWHAGPYELPLIDGALATFACARHRLVDAGDHLILIGRVLRHEVIEGKPLGFFNGAYFDLGLENRLADAATKDANGVIAAVLADGERILLEEAPDGTLAVPKAPLGDNTVAGFVRYMDGRGLAPRLDHLYAVFQNSQTGAHSIVYHGTVSGAAPEGMRYHDLAALPLEQVASSTERSMLARYQREYRHGSFGIYHGTESSGVVHSISDHTEYTV
ncbi:cag pathogenicity island protein Cag11 [Ruegeria sediminis]|uniref:Cag pathogenicity island protein Cag11 n=1 Tax=Ruegeria sediminis TaxID=2583820 RepID=A0ABY2X1J1_9RHOB|nr:CoA transferase [Ruegeria sediminis]TMV09075.1 cag pathogenicity island protein Cag11 [Ruegeria sediminis]